MVIREFGFAWSFKNRTHIKGLAKTSFKKLKKIMSKFISINPASEVAATLTQHPDYELFSRLSSVENFATRQYGTGG